MTQLPDRARPEALRASDLARTRQAAAGRASRTWAAARASGVVVPGMVDRDGETACCSRPRLGWRDVPLQRAAGRGHRPARADRELRQGLRAVAHVVGARRREPAGRPRLRQRLGRRRRRRRPCAASSCAAGTTWRASSATCRSPSTARPARAARAAAGRRTSRTWRRSSRYFGRAARPGPPDPDRGRHHDRRRPDPARARRRRQGAGRPPEHGALPRPRARRRS